MNTNDLRMQQALIERFAAVLWRLLQSEISPEHNGPAFWAWPAAGRAVFGIDPLAVKNIDRVLSARFVHHFSTALGGRKVISTNSRGIYFQVAYQPAQAAARLDSIALDLDKQPGPLHVPLGMTRRGPLWLPIDQMDAVLIGGARRMGKTRLIHSWIMALRRGKAARVYIWDGKDGLEFARYTGGGDVVVGNDMGALLLDLTTEAERRGKLLRAAGVTSLPEYNRQASAALPALVLIVDEAAMIPAECWPLVHDLIARWGASGVYPVLATQRPSAQAVSGLVKGNLNTRIALAVPSDVDSRVILGRGGAEKMPKQPGRMLVKHGARLIECQAFAVEPPEAALTEGNSNDVLTERERSALALASENEGRLTAALLQQHLGLSEWEARSLLIRLESLGLASKDGQKGPRLLSKGGWDAVSQFSQ